MLEANWREKLFVAEDIGFRAAAAFSILGDLRTLTLNAMPCKSEASHREARWLTL